MENKTLDRIKLDHGAGGRTTHELIQGLFFRYLGSETLHKAGDAAVVPLEGARTAFTTDSFVVKPAFFPGGDIGKIAVCGTVNDIAMMGATARYLTCGFILEEGFPLPDLERVLKSMNACADEAGVEVVAGDTKVVSRGEADGIFINTSGIGEFTGALSPDISCIRPGDKVIITGTVGDHGMAVMASRKGLELSSSIESDCAPLNGLVESLAGFGADIRFMRDPTRGGVATTLNEVAEAMVPGIMLYEDDIPVRDDVRGACELLGLDPLYMANEGKALVVVSPEAEQAVLETVKGNRYGQGACVIGDVTEEARGKVCVRSRFGPVRILDMLASEPLPRIC